MKVAILGAGAGGCAATAELLRAGHDVVLWNRSMEALEPFLINGGVCYEGVLGAGVARPKAITDDISSAVADAEAILVCLPTFSQASVARRLAETGVGKRIPVILNPGHTGGALEFATVFRGYGVEPPPIVEFSTLTYVARKLSPERVTVTGRAKQVRAAALPGGEAALIAARKLFDSAFPVRDVLNSGLSNVNLVLHPPGAILGAAWIEARKGDFTFYVDGMTPGVGRVMKALDLERRAVARGFGHELPTLIGEMQMIGTVESSVTDLDDYVAAVASGIANRNIKAPDALTHRYYLEDFGHGLVPFLAFARLASIAVPVAASLLHLASTLTGVDFSVAGRTAERMGIADLDVHLLMARVRC
jgi:opine dehydrogenase